MQNSRQKQKQKFAHMTFGSTIRFRRLRLGLGLRAFARQVGMDPGNLSKYETGALPPPWRGDTARKLGRALGMQGPSLDALVQRAREEALEAIEAAAAVKAAREEKK